MRHAAKSTLSKRIMHITHYVKTTKIVKQNVESALGLFPAFSFPAFSTPAIFSRIFFSRFFHTCNLVPHFHFLHFPPLRSCAAFSFPAFSISRILSVPATLAERSRRYSLSKCKTIRHTFSSIVHRGPCFIVYWHAEEW